MLIQSVRHCHACRSHRAECCQDRVNDYTMDFLDGAGQPDAKSYSFSGSQMTYSVPVVPGEGA
jgi:hypothetical protein